MATNEFPWEVKWEKECGCKKLTQIVSLKNGPPYCIDWNVRYEGCKDHPDLGKVSDIQLYRNLFRK